ncbi:MAG TPA: hypothetical protein VGO56_21910 [Pyrinomonadaceae bacterium]|jgi:hypothetical protein|nr:hypothetical protein [Pyrinomonadaceae bacterium]
MKLRKTLSIFAGLILIGASEFVGTYGTITHADAFGTVSSANVKPIKAGDLVLIGTVKEIQPRPTARSRKNWLVVVNVDRVVSGEFSGTTFTFAVHSPARAGLEVGRSYTVTATRTASGYVVDELHGFTRNVVRASRSLRAGRPRPSSSLES